MIRDNQSDKPGNWIYNKPITIAENASMDPIDISTCRQMITIIWPIAMTKIRGIAKNTALQLSNVMNLGSIIAATMTKTTIIEKIPSSLILKNLSNNVILNLLHSS